jgi:hypothetical protein
MNDPNDLTLHEELLLLALDDDSGTVVSGAWWRMALAGALLTELTLRGAIALDADGKKVRARSAAAQADDLLDEALRTIRERSKPRKIGTWLQKLSGMDDLKRRAAARLCERGVLAPREDTVLLFFKREVFPATDPGPERALVERLRRALLHDRGPVDPRTAAVVALAHHTGLLKGVLDKKERKAAKARIEEVASGNACGQAAAEAIQALQAAIIVTTVIIPTATR